ncbi:MAG: hypothetical protein GXX96_10410 [Planctomycetaceae bacterium]|nr:hypothetical protein [Planctomycetaceae bacterium]
MKQLIWALLFLAFSFTLGCGSNPGPPPSSPEAQAESDAHDAAVDEAEAAQGAEQ